MKRVYLVVLVFVATPGAWAADKPARRTAREALQPFNDVIGSWRCTGVPEGSREERQKGFWTETAQWSWQFKGDDAWLIVTFDKGKYFSKGELRYLPDQDRYQLTLHTTDKEAIAFTGSLKEKEKESRQLFLERTDDKKKETQKLVFTFLHSNRYLCDYHVKSEDRTEFAKVYRLGATKEGVAFATGDSQPECIVSGGLGTIPVVYKGQTYHVCCTGCRDAFKEDPEKFLKELAQRKAKKP